MPKLTQVQEQALEVITRDGEVYAHNGISKATARALASMGLVTFIERSATRLRPVMSAGDYRGRLVSNWSVRSNQEA